MSLIRWKKINMTKGVKSAAKAKNAKIRRRITQLEQCIVLRSIQCKGLGRSTRTLISPENEIEIYHLTYVASTKEVMSDGSVFSGNEYVLGWIAR